MRTKKAIKQQLRGIHSTEVHTAIHAATLAISGIAGGMAQLPASDAALITPIQIGMIIGIGNFYGIRIDEAAAKSILGSFATAFVGRTLSQLFIGWIPGFGNGVNIITAIALTEALGWYTNDHFAGIKAEEIYKNEKMINDLRAQNGEEIKKYKEKFTSAYKTHVEEEKEYNTLKAKVINKYAQVRLTITDEENEKILDIIQYSLTQSVEELNNNTFSKESPSFMTLKLLDEQLDNYIKNQSSEDSVTFGSGAMVSTNNTFLSNLNYLVGTYIKH